MGKNKNSIKFNIWLKHITKDYLTEGLNEDEQQHLTLCYVTEGYLF